VTHEVNFDPAIGMKTAEVDGFVKGAFTTPFPAASFPLYRHGERLVGIVRC
jgi:hypothetical protein